MTSSESGDIVVENSGTADVWTTIVVRLPAVITGSIVGVVVVFFNKCGGAVFLGRLVVVLAVVGTISSGSDEIDGFS